MPSPFWTPHSHKSIMQSHSFFLVTRRAAAATTTSRHGGGAFLNKDFSIQYRFLSSSVASAIASAAASSSAATPSWGKEKIKAPPMVFISG
jgi:hypothetical protein